MTDRPTDLFVYPVGDKSITLSPFESLPAGVFRKNRDKDGMEQMFAIIEAGMVDDKDLDTLDALPLSGLNDLFEKWTTAGGADYPKS